MPNVGLFDRAFKQPLQTIDITVPTPQETLLETPESLPTSEPGTSQISYTIQSSDLPTLSFGICKYAAHLCGAGQNLSGSSVTVYYRILKNGTSVATGSRSSVSNNYYYNIYHTNFYNVVEGDTIELRLWASVSGVNYNFKGLIVYPTRIGFSNQNNLLLTDISYTLAAGIKFTSIASGEQSANTVYYKFYYNNSPGHIYEFYGNTQIPTFAYGATYHFGRIAVGDMNTNEIGNSSSTKKLTYNVNYYPSKITFRNPGIVL
jgi:hypothetical protein